MIQFDHYSKGPNSISKKWNKLWLGFRQRLTKDIEILDGNLCYRFRCETLREFSRCRKIFIKEPGTYEWIKNEIHPGEIFFDIGANIGVYTILAAHHIGIGGKVYAFEPHSANFTRLLDNISVNNLQDIVIPCNFALHDEDGFFHFNYLSSQAGTSQSQLSSDAGASQTEFQPEISELKYAATIDTLIAADKIPAPHHIKIDVDGNELLILRGMKNLLGSPGRPKSIQVEIDKHRSASIQQLMNTQGYALINKHYTRAGQKRKERGGDPEEQSYNAIFKPER